MNDSLIKWGKAAGAVVVLVMLALTVNNWLGDYRSASSERATVSQETSSAPSDAPTETKEGSGESDTTAASSETKTSSTDKPDLVVVKIEGLNLRKEPNQVSDSIVGLKKGDKLVLIKKADGWYQVKTDDGKTGWVSSRKSYTKIEKQ